MNQPQIHFAHGNSFPAGTYRQFLDQLAPDYEVRALAMHGHNPRYPVGDCWPALVQEFIDELGARYTEPVILLGHSLGGMLSMMVAKARPDLVRCVVMLDAPVVAGWRALFLRLMKLTPLADKYSPAAFSAKRRYVWPDAEAAYQHFASKDIFMAWAPGVLRDYLDCGLKPHPEGVQLSFLRDIETEIYRTLPHNLGNIVGGRYPVPIGFIGGDNSWETSKSGLDHTRRLVSPNFRIIPGSHLFPMESPALAAAETKLMIAALLAGEKPAARVEKQLRQA